MERAGFVDAGCRGGDIDNGGGAAARVHARFEQKARPNHSAEQERIAYLEKKIQTKDEDLAELMAEHVALKKDIAERYRGTSLRTRPRSRTDEIELRRLLRRFWTAHFKADRRTEVCHLV